MERLRGRGESEGGKGELRKSTQENNSKKPCSF